MRNFVAKLCLLLTLAHFSITDWVEIAKSDSKPIANDASRSKESKHTEARFSTPSSVWIEYQRERFGLSHSSSNSSSSNSNSNPLVVSDVGGLKNSAQIVVPINSQVIHARTKLMVRSTQMPPVNVDVNVLVAPNVETTSRRHSSHVENADDGETVTEPTAEDGEDESLVPSMQGFLKFLKKMQISWIKKSALSIENKIKLLKNIRDNLMKVIGAYCLEFYLLLFFIYVFSFLFLYKTEEQFSVLWQPTERHRRRKRRGLLDESSLDFPPEAALMSINFLTFAVFLIKLVLVS